MDNNFIKKFLKGSASASIGTLLAVVFHFLSVTLMARFATKEVLGLYFLILAIANGGKIFASMGLDLTLVQFLVSEESDIRRETFAAIIWFRLCILSGLTLLAFLLGGFLLASFNAEIVRFRWTIPLLITLMSFRELFFYVLQGLEKYRLYVFVQISSAILKLILIVALVTNLTLMTLIFIEFAMLGGSLLLQIFIIPFKELSPPRFMFQRAIVPKMFRFGLPLYANSIFTYISNFGAIFIVGLFLSPASIAAYEVARKIPEGFMRLFTSFRVVYFPSLSSLFAKNDIKNAQKLMNKSLILLATGTFAIVLAGLLFGHEIVLLVFSEKWIDTQTTFVLLLFAVCTHLLASTMGYSLVSAGYPKRSAYVNMIAMGIELGLSFLLIPQVGYIGAALSYIIMTTLSQILCTVYLGQAHVWLDLKSYFKPYAFLIAVSLTYLWIGSEAFLWRVTLMIVYFVLSLAFIPDCRHAIIYLWKMVQDLNWHHKPKLEIDT